MSEAPHFDNRDNALIWAELTHIKESNARIETTLGTINGKVTENTAYRLTAKERWRTHEKEHDNARRNGTIVSGVLSGGALVASIVLQALGFKVQP
jgi:hypothetical protein